MKRIMIAIPTTGLINFHSFHSLMEMMMDCARMEKDGYKFILCVLPRMLVAQARETAVEKAIETKCDYLFFIDDDHLVPRGIMQRLLSHNKDIVGAMSFERMGDHNPNIYFLYMCETDGKDGDALVGTMRWSSVSNYEEKKDENGLLPVDVVGFGCVLINMRVFAEGPKQMKPTWFLSQFNVGEDFFFCWRAKQLGWEVWADVHPDAQLPHLGDITVITEESFKKRKTEKEAAAKALGFA